MSSKLEVLERRIARIKEKLTSLGDLRPGTLSEQYNVCGTPHCQCKADPPKKHGPYFQLGWSRKRKSTTRFIRKPDVREIKDQLRNYAQMQTLVDQWVEASIEICDIKLQESRQAAKG
ncbi:MAG: hypothetical protein GY930_20900 [bacterium]|nr:hypothetical protein [bacterium]